MPASRASALTPLTEASVQDVIAAIEQRFDSGAAPVLAFDGDGTLWRCDVGEWSFDQGLSDSAFLPAAEQKLKACARAHGLPEDGDATSVAARIVAAYRDGCFPEDVVCEVMVWAYAGWTEEQVRAHARRCHEVKGLEARVNRKLVDVIVWARDAGLRTLVVSASPQLVVEEAATLLGIAPSDIIGGVAKTENGVIAPEMASELPYAKGKAVRAEALLGTARWLAAFGDSSFDFELLAAAEVPVLVNAKPSLVLRAPDLVDALVLER